MAREVPYPAKTDAKGWRFELAYEQIEKSDTWALAKPDVRPWLLMLWMIAWKQVPCGSLPDNDELIATRIGMPLKAFAKAKPVLMRGWWLADDGRLYHDTIVDRVNAMLEKRAKDAKRAANSRARSKEPGPDDAGITGVSRVTPDVLRPEFDTKHQAVIPSVPNGTDGGEPPAAKEPKPKTPEEMAKAELWHAAVSVLEQGGCPRSQCRTFVGKLVQDYTFAVVQKAIAQAVATQPADAREYLKATCQRLKGERVDAPTVPSAAASETAAYLASQVLTPEQKAANADAARLARLARQALKVVA